MHGIIGIVNVVELATHAGAFVPTPSERALVDRTVAALADIALRADGRVPSHPRAASTKLAGTTSATIVASLGARDIGLVQLCHGAPGCVAPFARLSQRDAAQRCVDDVFARGLLVKGVVRVLRDIGLRHRICAGTVSRRCGQCDDAARAPSTRRQRRLAGQGVSVCALRDQCDASRRRARVALAH